MELITYKEFYDLNNGDINIDSGEFKILSSKASTVLDFYTFDRIDHKTERVVNVMNKLILAIKFLDDSMNIQRANGNLKSESVDQHSVAYGYLSEKEYQEQYDKITKSIIVRHLAHTGLLYRGFGGGPYTY